MRSKSKTILLSTAYLPPISWVAAANEADQVYIEAFESYSRQTFRNRCNIITANGPMALSIPVKKDSGNKMRTKDVEIFYEEPWQRLHWRTIDAAYSNSPFFLYYKDEFIPFYEKSYKFLLDYNNQLLEILSKALGIKLNIVLTNSFNHEAEDMIDLRNSISPKSKPANTSLKPYNQVFQERHGFIPDLSIIDLLFNEGPAAEGYLNFEL